MKKTLLASVAIFFIGTTSVFAVVPVLDFENSFGASAGNHLLQLAKDGSSGSDNSGSGSSNSGSSNDDSDDDDSDDDDDNDNDDADDDNDNDNQSNSGRSKPRVPGGSGCDDPGDVEEHAECRAQ